MEYKRSIAIGAFGLLGLAACGERDVPDATNVAMAGPVDSAANETSAATNVVEAAPTNSATGETLPPKPAPQSAAACRMQDGEQLTMTPLRAVGTEPFWGARIDGRCVTYSTPDDQAGTRIWTKFNPGADGGVWSGSLDGRQFELRTRPAPPPGCSDGMSDNRYPYSVTLRVGGETRTGCAKPA